MSYRNESDESGGGAFLKRAGAIVLGLLAFTIAKALVSDGLSYLRIRSTTPSSIEQKIESDPKLASIYDPMRRYFPDDYHELTSHVASMIRDGASEDDVYKYVFETSHTFVQNHSEEIASASTETLFNIAGRNASIAENLSAESPVACSAFGFDGLSPNSVQQLSDSIKSELRDAGPLSFRAAYEGLTKPVTRPSELSNSDARELIAAVRAHGLSEDDTETLFGEHAEQADLLGRCRMTVALYKAIADMPRADSAKFTAYLVRAAAN